MSEIPAVINAWQMIEGPLVDKETKTVKPGRLEHVQIPLPDLGPGDALVKVAGCGVCHTDLGYFYDGVPTVNRPPLTLGHEIAGTVVAGPDALKGKHVLVPAVMPCNDCPICAAGRGNRCLNQKMPGNSLGSYGGFADYIPVPAADLCVIEDVGDLPLSHYSVIADAGTTPYQAAMRAGIQPGDRVMVFGAAGGVGGYVTQITKALGADVVIGLDINQSRLERAAQYGADYIINVADKDFKAVRDAFRSICKEAGVPHNYGWKIFEVTGAGAAQDMALALLGFTGKLIVVGFGQAKNTYAVSRLMAFDAEIIGTWGCLPKYYPRVLELVQSGKVHIEPFLETKPMSMIAEVFDRQHHGAYEKRQVLEPDF
ncbi:MAG: 6-hydroxycyclohex-1-ene-1-carbonyl-CoA dehydrogenase [Proteobacteria bacterium]|nr:6-hydroxycyclohex-1-ene-1-carbonyl-CoA dehydrogenase [Pseudomonadota bacterium]